MFFFVHDHDFDGSKVGQCFDTDRYPTWNHDARLYSVHTIDTIQQPGLNDDARICIFFLHGDSIIMPSLSRPRGETNCYLRW
jgi:hypothetical protein